MTPDSSVATSDRACAEAEKLAELVELRARAEWAESRAANLECALATNRRIGVAIGVLMCQRHITAEDAFDILKTRSQRDHVKLRDLAETVIWTGTL